MGKIEISVGEGKSIVRKSVFESINGYTMLVARYNNRKHAVKLQPEGYVLGRVVG